MWSLSNEESIQIPVGFVVHMRSGYIVFSVLTYK